MRTLILAALVACGGTAGDTGPGDGGDTGAVDTGDSGDSGDSDTDVATLHGTAPAEALPAPEFTATNRDGTLRDRSALLGHPTVMWFFPFAGSPG